MPLELHTAKILSHPAEKVWAEMRDFVEQTNHFGLRERTSHTNPGEAKSDAVGCIRHITQDPPTEPVGEKCTRHSDKDMMLSLTVLEPNPFSLQDYDGTMQVKALTDGTCLCTFDCTFVGAEIMAGFIADFYKIFFTNIDKKLSEAPKAVLVGPLGADGPVDAPAVSSGGYPAQKATRSRHTGKVAIVTGGASGLGMACCQCLASEGATVVVADRNLAQASELATQLLGAYACEVDVTVSGQVDSMFELVKSKCGRVDILVNNAGIAGQQVPTHKHPVENWTKVLDVNLNGAFFCLRAALATMKEQQGGVIVNMSSTAGIQAMADIAPYTASKAALVGLTRSTSVEYAKDGIRVVALAPTVCKTPLVEGFMQAAPEKGKAMMQFNPMPGMPLPEDVGKVCAFVCSDDAKWVSGSTLPIDGAYLAGSAAPHSRG